MMKHLSSLWTSLTRHSSAYRIAVIYLVISVVWIIVTDQLVGRLVPDPATQTTVNTLKGWGFVAVTTWLIYALIRRDTSALHISEDKYRTLVEAADDAILLTDLQGRHLFANSTYYTSLGYAPGDDENLNGFSIVHPDDAPFMNGQLNELLKQGHLTTEYRVRHKDGQWLNRFAKSTVIYDTRHQPTSILAIVRDVTDHRQAESQREAALAALRDSEAKFRSYIEYAPLSVLVIDQGGRLVEANSASTRLLGYSTVELKERAFSDIVALQSYEAGRKYYQALAKLGSISGELALRRKDEAPCWVVMNAVRLADNRFMAYLLDITDRKRTESQREAALKALRESEERYRLISENTADVIWVMDPIAGKFTYVSPSVEKLRGYTPDEVMAQPALAALTPESAQLVSEVLAANLPAFIARGAGTESFVTEVDQPCKDGSIVHTEVTTTCLFNPQGRAEIVGVSRDMTKRKQVEAARRESEERYRGLFEHMVEGYAYCRMLFEDGQPHDWIYLTVNDAFTALTGLQDVSGKRVSEVIPGIRETDPDLFAIYGRVALTGQHEEFEMFVAALQMWFSISVYCPEPEYFVAVFDVITDRKQAEAALRESEARLNGVVGSAMDAIISVGGDQRIVLFNAAAEGMFRCSAADVIGQPLDRFIPERQRAAHRQHIRRFGETGETSRSMGALAPLSAVRADGEEFPIEASISQVEAGGEKLFTVILRDITLRQQVEEELRESEERFRSLYENSTVGIYRTTPAGRILLANPALVEMLGYSSFDDLAGRELDRDGFEPAYERAHFIEQIERDGTIKGLESAWTRHDGKVITVSESARAIRDPQGKTMCYDGIVEDITERKQAQEEVIRLNETLEQRVADRTAQLEAANQELEAFAYSISHDLRAPLRAIDGFSRIILEDYAARLDDEGRRMFEIVRSNTQKMDQLITDLLALSRVSRSQLTRMDFDMTVQVHDVYRTIASPADLANCTLTVAPLLQACGDPALLRQVWANLLSNAVKYSRPRAERHIEVGSYVQGREQVYYVKDNGVGFKPEYAHKLFGIFQRLHSADEFEGTGVGLAIVQRIVHRHGGRVWAEGQPDQGATFYFSLPCLEAPNES